MHKNANIEAIRCILVSVESINLTFVAKSQNKFYLIVLDLEATK